MTPHPTDRHSGGLIGVFLRHPNAANLLMALMILFGVMALIKINTQFFPTLETKRITVSVGWPGASAEDVEGNIIESIEPLVRFIDGVDGVDSYAREGGATIQIDFEPTADMQTGLSDVESAIAGITNLPEDSETPKVTLFTFRNDIAKIALKGPFSEAALKTYAKRFRDDLIERGIDKVTFEGLREEEIAVVVPERTLRQLDMTIGDISDRIAANTRDIPAGDLKGTVEKQLRTLSASDDMHALSRIEIKSLPSGETIRLGDVATVEPRFDADATRGYSGGERAIEMTVWRAPSADELRTAKILNDYLDEIAPTLPPTLELIKYEVRADLLKERIMLLVKNGVSGLFLVVFVLFMFLNWRVAFWVAAGIPVAMLATMGLMWVSGQTINMISLFALIMTLGIIVDDAIVVGEHTDTRYQLGDPPLLAAENGAGRMVLPVIAASLTTMATFSPILLIRGDMGQIMGVLPLVVVAVLTASLIECFFILPEHLRIGLGTKRRAPSRLRDGFDRGFAWFRDGPFNRMVEWAFAWRYTTIAAAIGLLIISAGFMLGGRVGFVFFPSPEPENIRAEIEFNAGIPEDQAIAAVKAIEAALKTAERNLTGGTEQLVVASFVTLGKSGFVRDDNVAGIDVQLSASEIRTVRTPKIVQAWKKALPEIVGAKRIAIVERRMGPPGRDLDIRLEDADTAVLKDAAGELSRILTGFPGVSGVADDLPYGKPELVMELTPRGAALGFTLQSVATQIRNAFEGAIARRLAAEDEEVVIRVEVETGRKGAAQLRDMTLKTPSGTHVPLMEVVTLNERQGFAVIQRRDGKVTVGVTADVDSDVTSIEAVLAELQKEALPDLARHYGLKVKFSGRDEERKDMMADLQLGLMIALGVIFIILAWIFGSYWRPFAVMLIIPFGLVGAIFGHYLMGFKLTAPSLISLLGLAGILVNDSIILVSRLDERLEQGDDLATAAIGAARDRLRAVLLTSLTTIGGLFPLLFEKSLQAQFLIPMAITIVFGLATTTLIVLFLVPALIGVGDDVAWFVRGLFGRHRPPEPQAAE